MYYCLFVAALYTLGMSVALKTENLLSSMLFKVMPMFSGLIMLLVAIVNLGWFAQ